MKKTLVPIVLTTVMIGLSGCANRNNYVGPNNHVNQNNVRSTNQGGPAALNDANRNLRISNNARNSVESLREVDRAHVIIQNNNAYVAVRLKNNGNLAGNGTAGTTGNGTNMGTAAPGAAGTNTGTPGTAYGNAGQANTGAGYGAPAPITGGDGTTSMGTGTSTGINGAGGNGTTAAGTGGGTGRIGSNGYGAAGTNLTPGTPGATGTAENRNNYRPVTTSLDKKIEKRVRAAERNVNRVYVSYDTDFYNRMGTYSNDLLNGRNRDGVFRDFTNTVRGMFR